MTDSSKSILWILNWTLFHTLTMSIAKSVSPEVSTYTLVFIRSFCGLFFLLPLLRKEGLVASFRTQNLGLHGIRVLFVCAAMGSTYYAYRNLPFALTTTIGFSQPLILTLFAVLFLKEVITWDRWLMLLVGYVGVLICINSSQETLSFKVLWDNILLALKGESNQGISLEAFMQSPAFVSIIALFASVFASAAIIISKRLTKTDKEVTIMLYTSVAVLILSGALASFNWTLPETNDLILIFIMGGLATFSQFSYIKALRFGKTSMVAPFEYARLVLAIPIGLMFFGEHPEWTTLVGAVVIILANVYIAKKS